VVRVTGYNLIPAAHFFKELSVGHSLKRSDAGIKVSRFLVFAVYVGDVNANAPVGVCLLLPGKNTLKV